jgi:hypothetical protein
LELTSFITDLWGQGSVTMPGHIIPFEEDDLKEAVIVLKQNYEQDQLNMPGKIPAFHDEASLWGACYLYRALQFVMLRDASEEIILEHLKEFTGIKTAEVFYSVDLSFRYLPTLFNFAKSLSPDDVLVQCLKKTANEWPLSSVGIELTQEPQHDLILRNTSLKQLYVDRITQLRDNKRAAYPEIKLLVQQALGNHSELLWPEFQLLNT